MASDVEPPRPPREVIIAVAHFNMMRDHAIARLPEEACGVLAGRDGRCLSIMPLTNALHSPTRYEIAPEELFATFSTLKDNDWELLGIFHSHPSGEAWPSRVDTQEAYYPNTAYLILAPEQDEWVCRAFLIRKGKVCEIALRIADTCARDA